MYMGHELHTPNTHKQEQSRFHYVRGGNWLAIITFNLLNGPLHTHDITTLGKYMYIYECTQIMYNVRRVVASLTINMFMCVKLLVCYAHNLPCINNTGPVDMYTPHANVHNNCHKQEIWSHSQCRITTIVCTGMCHLSHFGGLK